MNNNSEFPRVPAIDVEKSEVVDETGSELMERAKREVPGVIEQRLGCSVAEAVKTNPAAAEKVITDLMNEYVASEGNGMRHHFEIAAELCTWVRMAAQLKNFETQFNIGALIANDNTEETQMAA